MHVLYIKYFEYSICYVLLLADSTLICDSVNIYFESKKATLINIRDFL